MQLLANPTRWLPFSPNGLTLKAHSWITVVLVSPWKAVSKPVVFARPWLSAAAVMMLSQSVGLTMKPAPQFV